MVERSSIVAVCDLAAVELFTLVSGLDGSEAVLLVGFLLMAGRVLMLRTGRKPPELGPISKLHLSGLYFEPVTPIN